jgi:hypothetical protein
MHATETIEHKKINNPGNDKIDRLINKIISTDNYSSEDIKDHKTKSDQKKWIMPEEPQGFIKCKKHDPL